MKISKNTLILCLFPLLAISFFACKNEPPQNTLLIKMVKQNEIMTSLNEAEIKEKPKNEMPTKGKIEQNEGVYLLHETGFSKTVSIDHHPPFLLFYIFIEPPVPLEIKWDDVVIQIEAIQDGQAVGSRLIQGNTFYRMGEVGMGWDVTPGGLLFAITAFGNKERGKKHYFNKGERASYRLTVVQACEKYEYETRLITTQLW